MTNAASVIAGLAPVFPVLQNFIVLQGMQSPGVCRVRGQGAPRKWDEREGYGLSGAFLVYTGDKLSRFEVDIILWEPEHFTLWEQFATVIAKPPVGVRPTALDIQHPALNGPPYSIRSVVVEDVTGPERVGEGVGKFVYTIKFVQFRGAPRPALGKPDQAISAPDNGGTLTAQDRWDAFSKAQQDANNQIVQLSNEIKALGGL